MRRRPFYTIKRKANSAKILFCIDTATAFIYYYIVYIYISIYII